MCGHHIRDSDEPETWTGSDRDYLVRYCDTCLIHEDGGRLAYVRDGWDSTRGQLQPHFPEQLARRKAYAQELREDKDRRDADEERALSYTLYKEYDPTMADFCKKNLMPAEDDLPQLASQPKSANGPESTSLDARARIEKMARDYRSTNDICPYPARRNTTNGKNPRK